MGLIMDKLKEFGIPSKRVGAKDLADYDGKKVAEFIRGSNLIVIGEHYYPKVIRLMQLKFQSNMTLEMQWVSQSQIFWNTSEYKYKDVIALVQLFEEPDTKKRNLPAAVVNQVLRNKGQVVIGCSSKEALEESFPYDLDMLECEFEVWKGK